jgi:hypothetical protein
MNHYLKRIVFHANPPIGWIAFNIITLGKKKNRKGKVEENEKSDFFHKYYPS